ncbi:hypothetical protein JCM13664_16200 [Methylothermus subterraneus]
MKARLRRLHRLLALGLGVGLSAWVLAGSALLWQDGWPKPKAPRAVEPAILMKLLEVAQDRHPEPGSWRIVLPEREGEAVRLIFLAEDLIAEAEPQVLWLDPDSLQILRETALKSPLWQALYRFHAGWFLGDRGRPVLIACALALFALLASGLALWRRAYGFSLAACHRRLGLLIAPPLLISSVSGLVLALPGGWLGTLPAPEPQLTRPALTLEAVVAQAHTLFPDYCLREIVVPQNSDEPWELGLSRSRALALDLGELRLSFYPDGRLERQAANWRQWVYALHTGQVGGALGQVLLTLGGAGFAIQAVFGLRLRRRRSRLKAPALGARDGEQKIA